MLWMYITTCVLQYLNNILAGGRDTADQRQGSSTGTAANETAGELSVCVCVCLSYTLSSVLPLSHYTETETLERAAAVLGDETESTSWISMCLQCVVYYENFILADNSATTC